MSGGLAALFADRESGWLRDPGVGPVGPMACLSQPAAEAADGRKQNVPGVEQEGPGYRRNSASLQGWRMKSSG